MEQLFILLGIVNILAFTSYMYHWWKKPNEISMWVYPEIVRILSDEEIHLIGKIIFMIIFSIIFAPALILWYLYAAIRLIVLVVAFEISVLRIRFYLWRKNK